MKTTSGNSGRPKGAKTRYPGICKDASELGVSADHLRLVLKGKRSSVSLYRRWLQLDSQKRKLACARKPRKL